MVMTLPRAKAGPAGRRGWVDSQSDRWTWLSLCSSPWRACSYSPLPELAATLVRAFYSCKTSSSAPLDMRFAARGQRPHDERIVIVGIDEKTLQNIGAFPLPRASYASLVNRLSAGGASVIAFDATFPTPESNSAQQALSRVTARAWFVGSGERHSQDQTARSRRRSRRCVCRRSATVGPGGAWSSVPGSRACPICPTPSGRKNTSTSSGPRRFRRCSKSNRKDHDFDMGRAWLENGGSVYPGAEANLA